MKKILAITLTIVTMISCVITNAHAASTYAGRGSETIYVNTYNSINKPTITFQQKKLTATLISLGNKQKTRKIYGSYTITVENLTSGEKEYTRLGERMWSGSSKKYNLKKNSSYYITISYDDEGTSLLAQNAQFGYKTHSISTPLWTAKVKNAEISK